MRPKESIIIWEEDEDTIHQPSLRLPQHMDSTAATHPRREHVPLKPASITSAHQKPPQGTLSLHEYRKHLSQPESPAPTSDTSNSEGRRRLRRKKRAANLNMHHSNASNQDSEMMSSRWYADQSSVSVSSASSTPPSLSSSYSVSALSQTQGSEADGDVSVGPGFVHDALRGGNGTKEDTISSKSPQESIYKTHNKACSDTVLSRRGTTLSHEGTSFQILNPRDSLRYARIVSFIEDAEYSSPRGVGVGSFGRTESIAEENEGDIYDGSVDSSKPTSGEDQKAHLDIMGDIPRAPIPSISSRLESERGGSESSVSPIIPPPDHPTLKTGAISARPRSGTNHRYCHHEQPSPLSSTEGTSPHSDDTDLAYFHPLPNPASYPFAPSPAGEMANIHSFYIHDPSHHTVQKKAGPTKLRKSQSAAACTPEKKRLDVFRPFRRLRNVVRRF